MIFIHRAIRKQFTRATRFKHHFDRVIGEQVTEGCLFQSGFHRRQVQKI